MLEQNTTEMERQILRFMFRMVKEMQNLQGGYLDMEGEFFNQNDLFDLAEKLGVKDY